MLIRRRLTDARVRANSSISDIMILFVLLAQLLLGLLTIVASTGHMDGSVPSIVMAASGRRVAELEFDLLTLLGTLGAR